MTVNKMDGIVSCKYVLKKRSQNRLAIMAKLEPGSAQEVLFGARACVVNWPGLPRIHHICLNLIFLFSPVASVLTERMLSIVFSQVFKLCL